MGDDQAQLVSASMYQKNIRISVTLGNIITRISKTVDRNNRDLKT